MHIDPRITAIGLGLEDEVDKLQARAALTDQETLMALAMATYGYARGLEMSPRQVAQYLAEFVARAEVCETPEFRAALRTPRRRGATG